MTANSNADRGDRSLGADATGAWNRYDAEALASIFAEDGEFTNVFGMTVRGRAAIAGLHAPLFRTIFTDSHLSVGETRVRLI